MADQSGSVLIAGGTGLVGREIVKLLLHDKSVRSITSFVRRESGLKAMDTENKLNERIVDFEKMNTWAHEIQGQSLFLSLGTTLKTAGSKEAQYKVDYQYQWDLAQYARKNGCNQLTLISSTGANPNSSLFYLRTKGELESDLGILHFPNLNILRPSGLMGDRTTLGQPSRLGETIATALMNPLKQFLPMNLRPISAETVARLAVTIAHQHDPARTQKKDPSVLVFEPRDLHEMAQRQAGQ